MERESFENESVAALLNRNYISVKVDREERPDIDSVYMSVCQAMNGQGGWPLTIIMTPTGRPFFSGTYFPPRSRYGRIGMEELLEAVAREWKRNRKKLLDSAEQIEKYLKLQENRTVPAEPDMEVVHRAFAQFADSFDRKNGGFGDAPKFPTPHNLLFLVEYAVREGNRQALAMAETTLVQMYRGGIFDHIGGGFSRYSTDEKWLVPHFEKMLYDNALLVMAFLEAYGQTGRKLYSCVVRKVLEYVERELTDVQGGFYCGQDADSGGEEGKYYVLTQDEITKVLGGKEGEIFCGQYGITSQGNFEGKNIPNLLQNENYETICEAQCSCNKLYEYRVGRTKLHKDDKILVSWNGWMICACARAGAVLGEKRYLNLAVRAEAFISRYLVRDGRLLVRYRDGDAAGEGKLDDYACYILALLELYRVTFRIDYLSQAAAWAETMLSQFYDVEHGGFYLYAKDGEQLLVRTKETYDGALPSGNSVAARGLQQLAQITGKRKWQEALEKQLNFLTGAMEGYPSGHSYALLTMMDVLYPAKELVCTFSAASDLEKREKVLSQLAYLNETVQGLAIVVKTQDNHKELGKVAPYTADYPIPEKGEQYYLCIAENCMKPITQFEHVVQMLKEKL